MPDISDVVEMAVNFIESQAVKLDERPDFDQFSRRQENGQPNYRSMSHTLQLSINEFESDTSGDIGSKVLTKGRENLITKQTLMN